MTISDGLDAVFLPGKIHGCEHQLYVIYLNGEANDGRGSWEIEIIDADRILRLNEEVGGDAEKFFNMLPDLFHGEWRYCDKGMDGYDDLEESYPLADFIVGRDGGLEEELAFLVKWASQHIEKRR